jgi:D-glycerate 3-kinase
MHEPQAAAVNQSLFSQLEPLLDSYLRGKSAQINEIANLVASNPFEPILSSTLNIGHTKADIEIRLAILQASYPAIEAYKNSLNIQTSLLPETFQLYIPLALYMAQRSQSIRQQNQRAAVFGINGGQGSGKTTLNAFWQIILRRGMGLRTAGFSIDDVYKTYVQRQQMATEVHPLFATRSVAGTHDTGLAINTLNALSHSKPGQTTKIPRFDKMAKGGQGDRLPENTWDAATGPIDVVIFEGWLVGAKPQAASSLFEPLNRREQNEDPNGIWRRKANDLLATDYQKLFDLLDDLLVIQVRSMEDVYHNRELQEQHLRYKLAQTKQQGIDTGESGAMTPEQVIDFISLYERTTRHMLKTLPDEARVTLYLGNNYKTQQIRVN